MSNVKDGARQFAAGGCAGMIEVCLMHPLDLVKTRMQVQRKGDAVIYKNVFDCFRQMYRSEGVLSFYKGILPPILAETPKRATKFFTFEQYKRLFTFSSVPLPLTFSLAGFCSGLTEAVIICPFEVVKVKLQSERIAVAQQKTAWATAREIIAERGFGLNGIFLGLTSTLMRHAVWNAVYFGLYHSIKDIVPPPKDATNSFMYRFSLGFSAGFLACCANIPFDVAKSRIQGPQPDPAVRKYKTCVQSMRLVAAEEGFAALYKGFVPKVMRLAPGGAIMFIVYDAVYDLLKVYT